MTDKRLSPQEADARDWKRHAAEHQVSRVECRFCRPIRKPVKRQPGAIGGDKIGLGW